MATVLALITDPAAWLSLVTLTALEIVLGVDNVVFLAILVARLPPERRGRARLGGLWLAMLTRVGLLLSLTWLMGLTEPLFTVVGRAISSRDLVLLGGGLFLLWKSATEIHSSMEGPPARSAEDGVRPRPQVAGVILQIAVIDIVFSFDSVITAVGLAQHVEIMVAAIVIAMLVMMFVARGISEFIERHPTIKMLALSFLILIGLALITDAFGVHIPKGYLYFAMAFSIAVEFANMRVRRRYGTPPTR